MFSRILTPLLIIVYLVIEKQVFATPVLLWSNANLARSSVSLSTIKPLTFLSESICSLKKEKVQLRLFVVDGLTNNEFQSNSQNRHSILTGAEEVNSAFRYYPNVADDIYKALSMMPQSNNMKCAHIHFELTSTKTFENLNDALNNMEVSINSLGDNNDNAVVMALLGAPPKPNPTTRSRRSIEMEEDIVISEDGTCMFYARDIILTNRTGTTVTATNYTLDTENSECITPYKNSTGAVNGSVILNLVWYQTNDENATIEMKINATIDGSYWYIDETIINNIPYRYFAFGMYSKMETPMSFSYVCTKANFVKYNGSTSFGLYDFTQTVSIQNLQFQPFWVNGLAFGQVNYCTSFFTSGIWMGITSSLLCLAILMFGVSRMMNIKSNERFDDPKGKPLVIKAQE